MPGETATILASGLGATLPALAVGKEPTGSERPLADITMNIGGAAIRPDFTLIRYGVYAVRITISPCPSSVLEIALTANAATAKGSLPCRQ